MAWYYSYLIKQALERADEKPVQRGPKGRAKARGEAKAKARLAGTEKPEEKHWLRNLALYGGGAAIPAALAYALSRRVNVKGMTTKQQRVAKAMREKGYGVLTASREKPTSALKRWLQYGTTHVSHDPRSPLLSDVGAIVRQMSQGRELPKGLARKVEVIGGGRAGQLLDEGKLREALYFRKWSPGAVPDTAALPKLKGSLEQRLDQLRVGLERRLGKRWVLKEQQELQTAGALLSDKTKFKELLKRYGGVKKTQAIPGMRYTPERLAKLEERDPIKWLARMKANPDYWRFHRLKSILRAPSSGLAQKRVSLRQMSGADIFLDQLLKGGFNPSKEIRVHAIGGRVLPASMARFGTATQLRDLLGPKRKEIGRAERFVQRVINRLPPSMRKTTFGFDVAPSGKGFKIIESNPDAPSGIMYPEKKFGLGQMLIANRAFSALQGQATRPLAAMRAGAAGLGGLGLVGAAGLASQLREGE